MGLLLCLSAVLSGCATPLPAIDREAIASSAIEASTETTLGRIAQDSLPEAGLSGFRLMPLGTFSFDTRIQLAKRAEKTLDVQYYHIENDETGRWFLRALRDAANRGVRVRLLLDDLYTGGLDDLFLGFASHPNVQVRLFNPFCCARQSGQAGRIAASLGDLKRVNHRMHNKLFVADGAMAVIGGRNVANEYYLRGTSENFIDLDAFVVGNVLPAIGALFDRYWNSLAAYPLESVARSRLDKPALLAHFEHQTGPTNTPEPDPLVSNDVLGYAPIADDLDAGRLGLNWGTAYVFADHPDKPFDGEAGGELMETSVTYNVLEAVSLAKREVVASSPYFVPGPRGMKFLRQLRDRGVKVTVLTNSLGSTDEPIVHTGYSRYREPMLAEGIDLYELSSSRVKGNKRPFLFGSSLGRLHAKLFVIDRKTSFIGSMNLDPRSATINTEFGAVIDSPEVARELIRVIDIDRLQSAYRLRLTKNGGGIEWLGIDGDKEVVLTTEPDTSFWLRLKAWLLSPLIPEEQL
ncbi:phospholipase D family protein [Rhodoferax sp.]|uniref:phospholipase D family protein n=1 Tax=Rhodoferax sp. TaxID=50421 RepID=UPI00275F0E07|nr:phospholipase D family protein [Rhodoferax sp.]